VRRLVSYLILYNACRLSDILTLPATNDNNARAYLHFEISTGVIDLTVLRYICSELLSILLNSRGKITVIMIILIILTPS
jgi:hypothetical protein